MGYPLGFSKIQVKTANYTIVAADNGSIFTTRGATGAVNFTLPTLAAGYAFLFINEADQNLTVTMADETAVALNDLTADSVVFSTMSEKIGSSVAVYSNDDASKWLVDHKAGTLTINSA